MIGPNNRLYVRDHHSGSRFLVDSGAIVGSLWPTGRDTVLTIGTAALIVCILAIVDKWNTPVPNGLEAFTVGFTVLVIGLSMGFNSGYAVNPARDLGPRLFTSLAGWGTEVFTAGNYWFWIPIFAPLLGSILGILVYQLMIGIHFEPKEQSSPAGEENVKLANVKLREGC